MLRSVKISESPRPAGFHPLCIGIQNAIHKTLTSKFLFDCGGSTAVVPFFTGSIKKNERTSRFWWESWSFDVVRLHKAWAAFCLFCEPLKMRLYVLVFRNIRGQRRVHDFYL